MGLQIVDPKSLRKLLKRVEELPTVKSFLEDVRNSPEAVDYRRLTAFFNTALTGEAALVAKKVKENQNLTALLQEIGSLVDARDFEGAVKVAKRVLEAEPVVSGQQVLKQ